MPTVRTVPRGSVDLAVREWGSADSGLPTVVLVHGYPDCSRVWDAVAGQLAGSHHVVAYDVRGAGASSTPKRIRDYRMIELVADLAAVMDACAPGRRVHLVGHDWGSIQSWESVCTAPMNRRILSYTSISGPCLDHVGYWLREHAKPGWKGGQLLRQLGRSWYIVMFQMPWLAPVAWKTLLGRRWTSVLRRLEGVSAEPTPTQTDDGRNGVNLYRANVLPRLLRPEPRRALAPVQLIIPMRDRFVSPELYEGLSRWVPTLRRRAIDAGHWLLISHPDAVARCIAEWVAEHRAG